MAVSGVTDFSLSAGELVEQAHRKAGILADEEPLQASDLQNGMIALTMMLKAWQADGVKYWLMTEGELTLVQGQESYSFAPGGDFETVPFDMFDIRISRDGTDLPMLELSREDYYALPLKTIEGYPTQWFYDRQRDTGTLYVWQAPDSVPSVLKFTYGRTINDMVSSANSMDLPQEWYEAVIYGLTRRIMENLSIGLETPRGQLIVLEAARTYGIVQKFNVGEGEGSFFIHPADQKRGTR